MSTQTQTAKSMFRNRVATQMPIEQRLAGCQPHADFVLVPCAGSCGHTGFHRVSMNLKTHALACDTACPGFQIRKTCVHVETAARCIAEMVMTFEGELTTFYTPVIAAAIVDLHTGAKELKHGYLWLVWRSIQTPYVRATRYGMSPDCEKPSYKIGLRHTDLSTFEAAACAEFLRLELQRIQRAA
jgi:hypothetical protein